MKAEHGRSPTDQHQWSQGHCTIGGCRAKRHIRKEPSWTLHIDNYPGHMVVVAMNAPATCSCGAQAPMIARYDARINPPR